MKKWKFKRAVAAAIALVMMSGTLNVSAVTSFAAAENETVEVTQQIPETTMEADEADESGQSDEVTEASSSEVTSSSQETMVTEETSSDVTTEETTQSIAEEDTDNEAEPEAEPETKYIERTYEGGQVGTAPGMRLFAILRSAGGGVSLKGGNYEKWFERIQLSSELSDFDMTGFYNKLVEGSDNDGVDDILIDDSYFNLANGHTIEVVKASGALNGKDIDTVMNELYNKYSPAISAAYCAFDRDHPEVFWLSGSWRCSIGASYGADNYTVTISFVFKKDGENPFDIRATDYNSQAKIEAGITTRDNRVNAILSDPRVSGKSNYEKIVAFNEILTTTNEYNTSSDLNNIGHDCRTSLGALVGRTGTNGPVCEAYARAFNVLCNKSGIGCTLVDGQAKNSVGSAGEAHMWNYVLLNGKWYGMDVTWNDPVGGASGAVSGVEGTSWSLVGSDTMISAMRFLDSHPVSNTVSANVIAFTNGPELNTTEYQHTSDNKIYSNNITLALPSNGYTYDATAKEPAVTVTNNIGETLTLNNDYTVSYSGNTNAGTATVTVTGAGAYAGSSATKTFSIAKAKLTPASVQVSDKTYDGNTEATVNQISLNGYYGTDNAVVNGATAVFADKNAGTDITVTVNTDNVTLSGYGYTNYEVIFPTPFTAKANILKRSVNVSADNSSKVYGQADPALVYTVDNATPLVSGESLVGVLSREAGEDTGVYDITQGTLTNANNPNYSITFTDGTFTVNAATEFAVSVQANQNIYTDNYNFNEPTFTGVNNETVSGVLSYTYGSVNNGTYADLVTELQKTSTIGAQFSVNYKFVASGNYSGEKTGTITLTLKDIEYLVGNDAATLANAVTIKSNAVYGDSWNSIVVLNPSLTAKRGSDTVTSGFSLDVTGTPKAGTQGFKVLFNGTVGSKTYTDDIVCEGTVNVAKRTVTVTADNFMVTKTYDGSVSGGVGVGNLSTDGIISGESVFITYNVPDFTNANVGGQSSMNLSLALDGTDKDNYQLASNSIAVPCEITPLTVSPVINVTGDYTYTGNPVTPEFTVETVNGSLSSNDYIVAVTDNVNAGVGKITITAKAGGNYTWSDAVSATFVINKATRSDLTIAHSQHYGNKASVDLNGKLTDGEKLGLTTGAVSVTDTDAILASAPAINNLILNYELVNDTSKIGKTADITIPVTAANYEPFNILVTVTCEDKYAQSNFAFAQTSVNKTYGDEKFTLVPTGMAEGSTVTYSSSDDTVAAVDKNGAVTIHKAGNVTITAKASETATHLEGVASYSLSVAKKQLTWNTSQLEAVDRLDKLSGKSATLYGVLTVDGIVDGDDAVFECTADKLAGEYEEVAAGSQTVILSWADSENPVQLTGNSAENYLMPAVLPEIIGSINKVEDNAVIPPESTDDVQFKLEVETGISQVPEAFKNNPELDTPAKIDRQLRVDIKKLSDEITEDNIVTFDVVLMVNIGDGKGWQVASADNFPENGLTVTLPYIEGTGKDTHTFWVSHMFTKAMNGHQPGETEYPVVTNTDEGITFKVNGLSPIAVAYKENAKSPVIEDTPATGENPPVTDETPATAIEETTEKSDTPDTGDNSKLVFIVIAMIVSGAAMIMIYNKKRRPAHKSSRR